MKSNANLIAAVFMTFAATVQWRLIITQNERVQQLYDIGAISLTLATLSHPPAFWYVNATWVTINAAVQWIVAYRKISADQSSGWPGDIQA